MPGKTRPSLRKKVLANVSRSNLSITDKKCIGEIFEKLLQMEQDENVVKVVRCKDCKWWSKHEDSLQGLCALSKNSPTGYWYCANGERKEI